MKTVSLLLLLLIAPVCRAEEGAAQKLDAWVDRRWEAKPEELDALVKIPGMDAVAWEMLLRAGRAGYPEPPQPRGKLSGGVPLECDHVDHATQSLVYVPTAYDPAKAVPLVLVAHGGSAGRDLAFGERAALAGIMPFWVRCAEKHGFLLVAPLTDRGWNKIGVSIAMSALSRFQRDYHIDPDRIYVTGHSMGGHMTWRSAIYQADRWGAVSPMSGGYDYVKDRQVYACFNVPGFATWGTQEPYQINTFNRTIKAWMETHGFPWEMKEKEGGHQIFPDEIEPVWAFFAKHPRNLYRDMIFARGSGSLSYRRAEKKRDEWPKEHTWRDGRPIPLSTFHWLRLIPLPEDTPVEASMQSVWAVNKGGNAFDITAENAKKLKLYLHPKMVDFSKPVTVTVNGEMVFAKTVQTDVKTMLELVREFDDRGRVFHAAIEVDVPGSVSPPEPSFR